MWVKIFEHFKIVWIVSYVHDIELDFLENNRKRVTCQYNCKLLSKWDMQG